jgi:hypothetical protein
MGAAAQKPVTVDFARDVRPVLAAKCFACHGPDEKHRMAGVRLDVRESALGKGAGGARILVPGRPAESSLITRIVHKSPALRMPPAASGKSLSPKETAILKAWVAAGAPYAQHWSFVPPVRPSVPKTALRTWASSPIDAFVAEKLADAGLKPSPPADRATLIRRVSLDLTGLPPTPTEVAAFISDRTPNAYEKVVDRMLASPAYGEKMARQWLDLARYADSAGYGSDPLRPNIWPWRDWVINAYNRNISYRDFTLQQLAGDLLPNPTEDQLVATAFHRNTMTNTEGGTDREEFRTAAVKDRTIVTAQVWMGLTVNCAQCHSHKFDPIPQRDFYRLMAFFNQTEDNDMPDERPTMPYWPAGVKAKHDALAKEAADLEARSAGDAALKPLLEAKKRELAALKPTNLPVMRELPAEKRRQTHVLVLGNFLNKGEPVEAAALSAFPAMPPSLPRNRLGLAEWLVSPNNPLTARVAVNRMWAMLFGRGLVETEEDFGYQGAFPSHPKLLDWLAVEFMESGWNIKAMLKRIVLSSTYRQSSAATPDRIAADPRNVLISRYPRRRLDAETVRDQALALSGLLSRRIGGPSVYPPQPDGLWRAAFNGERTWPTSTGEDRYRRGLYTFWRRTVPYPSMATFDAPSREQCTIRRIHTNTPLQALVTLNDPAYLEMAQALSRRIMREGGASVEARAGWALQRVTGKPASTAQIKAIAELVKAEIEQFTRRPAEAEKLATNPLGKLPDGITAVEAAAWTIGANVLLNLDAVLTVN